MGALFNVTGGMSAIGAPGMNGALLATEMINAQGGCSQAETLPQGDRFGHEP